jgi:hypothetical protein
VRVRRALVVAVALVVGTVLTVAASADGSGAPAGAPALDRMALAAGDIASGAVKRQGYVKDRTFPLYYVREFKPGASLGRTTLLALESDVGLADSAATATVVAAKVESLLGSRRGRQVIADAALEDAGESATGLKIGFGGVHLLAVGDRAFTATVTLRLPGSLRYTVVLELVRVDRVVQVLYLLGRVNTRIAGSEATRLVGVVAARMVAELRPASLAPPTISGTPTQGETLTVATGSWSNAPSSFSVQWLRCDPAGLSCTAIVGAVSTDYVVVADDVGATLEASVVATNAVGSSQPAVSAPTAIVVGPAAG